MALPTLIDPATTYDVVVARAIKVGIVKMLPRGSHEMTGTFLMSVVQAEGEDAIVSAIARE